MNNIKKFLSLLFVAVFALVLIGCGGGTDDKAILEEQADKIYLGDLSEINNDIKLPKYAFGNKEFTVTWASSNEEVIKVQEYENDDKELYYQAAVTMALEETKVTLTATVTYKTLTTTRTFEVNVLADEYKGYSTIAAVKAQEDKEKDVSMVKFSGTVAFSTGSGFGVTDGNDTIYCYGSGHGRTVGEKVEVRGVWTFYNNMVQLKNSNVKVLGTDANFNIANIAEEKSIAEIFAIKAESVDPVNSTRIFKTKFAAKPNETGAYNTYKLVDPLDSSKIVDVSKYNDATTLEEVGALAATGKFYEGIVIIYCSRSAGAAGLWDVLYVPGTAKEVEVTLTDAQKVSGIISDLKASFEGKTVDADLELPTADKNYGATIAWASSAEEVISSTGKYVAPANKTEVKLTATITLNSEVQTVELTVTAKAAGKTTVTMVATPEVGVAYKLGIDQASLGQKLFATGVMAGYYGATTEDHTEGIDVYLEAAEGGYYVYSTINGVKTYITAVISGTHINFTYSTAPNVAWVLNAEFSTITCTVDGKEVFIGTRGTYNTFGGYAIDQIASAFPAHFYKEEIALPYATSPEVGVAYKLGIDQIGLGQVLYATGAMAGYYGATTQNQAEAIDVYLETAEGGYYVTTTIEGAKKYICAVVSGNYINFKYEDAPNAAWVFNTEFNTITCTVDGKEAFIGTRGTYNTFGGYSVDELANDYPARFFFVEEGGNTEPEPKPEPSVKDITIPEVLAAAKDLEDKAKLEGQFKVTGKVTEVTGAYSDQYKNVTFIITDGTNTLEIFRAKGDEAANIAANDTVVLIGEVQKYGEKIQLVNAQIESRKAEGATTGSVVKDILDAAASLGDKEYLEGEFTVTGKVTEITAEYSEQYKNISFMLSDGVASILVYRTKGDEAANVKVGDTVTLTGKVQNYGGTIEIVNGLISARVAGEGGSTTPDTPVESDADAVLTFDSEANRVSCADDKQVWAANGITVTNNVHESTNPVKDYVNPVRFYANTNLVIEYTSNIEKIVITTAGGKNFAADFTIEGATVVVADTVTTITLNTPATSLTIDKLLSQVRVAKIEVYAAK